MLDTRAIQGNLARVVLFCPSITYPDTYVCLHIARKNKCVLFSFQNLFFAALFLNQSEVYAFFGEKFKLLEKETKICFSLNFPNQLFCPLIKLRYDMPTVSALISSI